FLSLIILPYFFKYFEVLVSISLVAVTYPWWNQTWCDDWINFYYPSPATSPTSTPSVNTATSTALHSPSAQVPSSQSNVPTLQTSVMTPVTLTPTKNSPTMTPVPLTPTKNSPTPVGNFISPFPLPISSPASGQDKAVSSSSLSPDTIVGIVVGMFLR